ncbi:MAG: hypothetical protein WKF73_07765 [Nocardioidaceae bacterium]
MSKRLQVVLDDAEFDALREVARQDGVTLSEWVRRSLRLARRSGSPGDVEPRLAAVRSAMRHTFPTAEMAQMLAEVEQGYRGP